MERPALSAILALGAFATVAAQQGGSPHDAHHAAVDARGAQVMGFDQTRTSHHFRLYQDGGAIDVSANDPDDAGSRDAIRRHLAHIATRFAAGRFDAPMLVHDTNVPGTDDLARLQTVVTWRYVETPGGGRIDIVTTQPDAITAVHRFLAFQIADHRTADDAVVARRP